MQVLIPTLFLMVPFSKEPITKMYLYKKDSAETLTLGQIHL